MTNKKDVLEPRRYGFSGLMSLKDCLSSSNRLVHDLALHVLDLKAEMVALRCEPAMPSALEHRARLARTVRHG